MRYFIDLENELVGLVPASISQGPDVAAKQDQLRGLGVDTERAEFYIFAKRAEVVLKREEETVLRCMYPVPPTLFIFLWSSGRRWWSEIDGGMGLME